MELGKKEISLQYGKVCVRPCGFVEFKAQKTKYQKRSRMQLNASSTNLLLSALTIASKDIQKLLAEDNEYYQNFCLVKKGLNSEVPTKMIFGYCVLHGYCYCDIKEYVFLRYNLPTGQRKSIYPLPQSGNTDVNGHWDCRAKLRLSYMQDFEPLQQLLHSFKTDEKPSSREVAEKV